MSTRADNYLSLCLEQAAKSPLHYRHGCIIVRGGKVIGQGYNDYRSGFDGGALNNGRLRNGAIDGQAIEELKAKIKEKHKQMSHVVQQQHHGSVGVKIANTPIKNGATAAASNAARDPSVNNGPLSMHSEMMAIQSALAASNALVAKSISSENASFRLPGDSKAKARKRTEFLKSYVERICKEASAVSEQRQASRMQQQRHTVLIQGTESRVQPPTSRSDARESGGQLEGEETDQQQGQGDNAQIAQQHGGVVSMGRCDQQQQQQYQYRYHYQYQYEEDSKSSRSSSIDSSNSSPRCSLTSNSNFIRQQPRYITTPKPQTRIAASANVPNKHKAPLSTPTNQASDRRKYPRLHGTDLYVARLGTGNKPNRSPPTTCPTHDLPSDPDTAQSRASTRPSSLHDELLHPNSKPSASTKPTTDPNNPIYRPNVLASRPCYRCISYMAAIGIKRVFWTNASGVWEGGKVRDLVDAFEGVDGGSEVAGMGFFVTKHEVLSLKAVLEKEKGDGIGVRGVKKEDGGRRKAK